MLRVWAACLLLVLVHSTPTLSNELYDEVATYNNETSFKANFAQQVVDKVHCGFRQWFFTIIFCEFTYFENRIVKYTENLGNPALLLSSCPSVDKVRIKPKIDRHGETAYIVSSNDITPELNEYVLAAVVRTGVWKPRSALIFVINVPVQVDSYFYHSMRTHFQLLWTRRITNSVLVVWSDRLRIYTYNPFFDEVKEVTEATDISQLLAKQYYNLYGKELRISVFRKVFISDETGPVTCASKLTTTVISYLNATCIPIAPRDGATVGDLLDNGTATGATADLIDGYTEIELNSRILKNTYYGYIDTTYPLVQDELCFLVKKSDRQSSFKTTTKLFGVTVLVVCICNVIAFIIITVVAFKTEKSIWMNDSRDQTAGEIAIDVIKCLLRQTFDVKSPGPVYKAIVMSIILYSLVIDCVIDGIITSAITYPRYKPEIDSLYDLAQSDLILAIHNRHLNLFKSSLSPNYEDLLLSPIKIVDDRKIKQAIDRRQYQYAILLRKSDTHYVSRKLANMKNGRPLFHTVSECPLPCFIVYGLEYGSPYLVIINKLVNRLNQAGILQHWSASEEYALQQTHSKILATAGGDITQGKAPLSMDSLYEVFVVWFIGVVASVIGLGLEIVYSKAKKMLWVT